MNEQGKHVLDRLRAVVAKGEAPKASDEEFAALVKYACELEDEIGIEEAAAVLTKISADEYVEPKK